MNETPAQTPPPEQPVSWVRRYGWALGALVLAAVVFSNFLAKPNLEGKPAPALRATLLDGGAVDLAEHAGREVVVLNFWASWCPPCRQEMPALDALAKSLAGKPVRFYASNVGEPPELIREFLAQTKVSLPVIVDTDGQIAQRFQAFGLSLTYIIGRDGVVKREYAGYAPGLENEIRQQIVDLL